jgi:hypothetical protein
MKRSAKVRGSHKDPFQKGHKQTTEIEITVNSEVGLLEGHI